MAITTLDGLIAGSKPPQPLQKVAFTGQAAGQLHSSLYLAGLPGAASAPSPGLAGAALTSYTGQIPFPSPVGGQSVYMTAMDVTEAGNIGGVLFCDRLWHNSGITSSTTTAQTVNSVAWPARDLNGAVTGTGLQVAIEVTTATTNGSPITNTTLSYTNTGATAGRTATIASFPANAVAGTFVPFALAAGDTGLTSIQTLTLGTSYGTGVLSLVVYRVVGQIPTPTANVTGSQDYVQLGTPIMYDNSVPWMVYVLSGTAGGIVYASLNYAQG